MSISVIFYLISIICICFAIFLIIKMVIVNRRRKKMEKRLKSLGNKAWGIFPDDSKFNFH